MLDANKENVSNMIVNMLHEQDLTHSLDTLKNISVKFAPQVYICDKYGT